MGDLEDLEHRNPGDLNVHSQLAALYARVGRRAEAEGEKQFVTYLHTRPEVAQRVIRTLDAATTISHPSTGP